MEEEEDEEGRGTAGGRERKEGREAGRGRVWSGEGGSVGVWDEGRKITVGQGGVKRK